MKFLAYIFLICMSFYMTQPIFAQVSNNEGSKVCCPLCAKMKHSCHSKMAGTSSSKSKHSCPDRGCTPFMSCSCCGFVATQNQITWSRPDSYMTSILTPLENHIQLGFVSRCWRPPKMGWSIPFSFLKSKSNLILTFKFRSKWKI